VRYRTRRCRRGTRRHPLLRRRWNRPFPRHGPLPLTNRFPRTTATAQPLLSTGFRVSAGQAYTVAGMGPAAGLRLQVLNDTLAVPSGQVLIRVIQASLREHVVSVRLTTQTLVVLDGAGHLRLTDLEDAAGSAVRPQGGAATGLGGMAPRPASSPLPWLALIGAGLLLASAAARGYRRIRTP